MVCVLVCFFNIFIISSNEALYFSWFVCPSVCNLSITTVVVEFCVIL